MLFRSPENIIISPITGNKALNNQLQPIITPIIPNNSDQSSPDETMKITGEIKTKRGRKRKIKTAEAQLKTDQIRMERNRMFAKQNRERKKEYVASLECKVAALTEELRICKVQLEQYKRRDIERSKNFIDFCSNVKHEIGKLQGSVSAQLLEIMKNANMNPDTVMPYIQETLNDRYNAIESMVEVVLKFSVPLTHQCLMCAAENTPGHDYKLPTPSTSQYPHEDIKLHNELHLNIINNNNFLSNSNHNKISSLLHFF